LCTQWEGQGRDNKSRGVGDCLHSDAVAEGQGKDNRLRGDEDYLLSGSAMEGQGRTTERKVLRTTCTVMARRKDRERTTDGTVVRTTYTSDCLGDTTLALQYVGVGVGLTGFRGCVAFQGRLC
jgi:hypothetical protein